MTTALVDGVATSILANTAYAVPPGPYRILALHALTYSATVGGVYAAMTGAELEPGASVSSGFIKCASNSTVVIKRVTRLNTYASLVAQSNPIAFWRMDEQTGTTFYDLMSGSNLTFGAGVTLGVTGPTGDSSYAATLNGAVSPQLTNSIDSWFNQTAISFEAWINNPAFAVGQEQIICLGAIGHYLSVTGGKLIMSIRTPASQYTNTATDVMTANTWHHVVGTWESGDYLRLYVDGVEVASGTTTVRTGALDTGPNIYIGAFSGSSLFWSGSLDDVALYLRKLSAAEVKAHYTARLVK